jgi:cytosylglucuronate decarboxylase
LGVDTWELSALKLPDGARYPDPRDVVEVGTSVYAGSLRPLGKPWYGATAAEQELYFDRGIPPRAAEPSCHVVDDVIYVDGRNGGVFPCSCLPHREDLEFSPVVIGKRRPPGTLRTSGFLAMQATYRVDGPTRCTGCSATAAGYSDDIERLGRVSEWAY